MFLIGYLFLMSSSMHPNRIQYSINNKVEKNGHANRRVHAHVNPQKQSFTPTSKLQSFSSRAVVSLAKATSYDLLNQPDILELDNELAGDQYSNETSASCQLKEAILYPYQDKLKSTALISFPRSGNTWVRSLIERSTSYSTSSVYCDKQLISLRAECDRSNIFLIKTHDTKPYAVIRGKKRYYDQFIFLVRNPFDSFLSYYEFTKIKHGGNKHETPTKILEDKSKNGSIPLLTIGNVRGMVSKFRQTFDYWTNMNLPHILIRYEDMRQSPNLISKLIRRFLLPFQVVTEGSLEAQKSVNLKYYFDNTSIFSSTDEKVREYLRNEHERIMCAINEDITGKEVVYKSNKFQTLHSLTYYRNDTIKFIIEQLRELLCHLQYNVLLYEQLTISCENEQER
jgi:hypothetical protein